MVSSLLRESLSVIQLKPCCQLMIVAKMYTFVCEWCVLAQLQIVKTAFSY